MFGERAPINSFFVTIKLLRSVVICFLRIGMEAFLLLDYRLLQLFISRFSLIFYFEFEFISSRFPALIDLKSTGSTDFLDIKSFSIFI